MENTPAPFDLNRALQQWRAGLDQSPAFRRENLDELESHVHDSIAHLRQLGLGEDEACLLALRRVGADAALVAEFAKVNAPDIWLHRALWMLVGIQLLGCLGGLVQAVSVGTTILGVRALLSHVGGAAMPVGAGLLYGTIHLLAWVLTLALGWRWLRSRGGALSNWLRPGRNNARRSTVIVAAGLVLILLPRIIGTGSFLLSRFLSPADTGRLFLGYQYGAISAGLLESGLLLGLTLILARRLLSVKTAC
jgi:hypothetical protein